MASIDLQANESASSGKPSGKTLILVHGRGWKPAEDELMALWRQALHAGVHRDGGDELLELLRSVTVESVYYGDLSNSVLSKAGQSYDAVLDLADRRNALAGLEQLTRTKQFRRAGYEAIPGRSSVSELLADIGAPILSTFRLTDLFLSRAMPEVVAYWDRESDYHREVSRRMVEALQPALRRGDDIMVIAHCLGSVVAFDGLWAVSRGESANKIGVWITLGSPLGDEFVKSKLAGSDAVGAERFPNNVINWYNVAAEDDYTCHDETVTNDFRAMLDHRLISRISDYRIYNLAVRYSRSNPHSALGYLVHPRVTKLVSAWLPQDGSS